MRFIILSMFLVILSCAAYAQVSADFSGANGGSVIVGYDSRSCDATIEGAISYNSSTSEVQICKPGGNSCPDIGDVCADGSVYAGESPDGDIPMYTTPSDEGAFHGIMAIRPEL